MLDGFPNYLEELTVWFAQSVDTQTIFIDIDPGKIMRQKS